MGLWWDVISQRAVAWTPPHGFEVFEIGADVLAEMIEAEEERLKEREAAKKKSQAQAEAKKHEQKADQKESKAKAESKE